MIIVAMTDYFYVFYKSVSQLFMPLGLGLLCVLISIVALLLRRRKTSIFLLLLSFLWMWLWSMPLWGDFMRGRLESKYAYQKAGDYPAADAIVVLGGGVRGYAGPSLPPIDLNRASDRELFASQLYKSNKAKVILLSGGADPILRTGASALGMKIFLIELGVPARAIRIDVLSRNTIENAREVARMVKLYKGNTILLVTSALHMQRAVWLFSQTGLKVIPAPTDFEVVKIPFSLYRLLPDAEAVENSSRAAREIMGLWVYRLGLH